jgi:hypothetical protein
MNLFLHRLKKVGSTLLGYLISIASLLLLMWLATLIPTAIGTWIATIIIGLFVGGMLWAFIYWLFVEPFKKERK